MSRVLDPTTYYRISRWLFVHHIPVLPSVVKVFSEMLFHCELPYTADIGRGFRVAHRGFGIVVHKRAVLGRNVVILPGVTIGGRNNRYEVPRIGDDVYIGPGAKILGDVTIGNGAVIGANAVVVHSVPSRTVAAGIPARILRENINTREVSGWPETEEDQLETAGSKDDASGQRKVLFVVESLALGGSEKQSVEVACRLTAAGWNVTVACIRGAGGPLLERIRGAGIPLVEFSVGSLLTPMAPVKLLRATLFMRRQRYQVVQANDLYSNLFAVPAAWLAGIPVIVSSRRDLSHWWWYTPLKRRILRAIQGLSSWVVVNSEAIREDLTKNDGFKPQRIRVVYNGIDTSQYIPPNQANRDSYLPGLPSSSRLVIAVANMHILVKGHLNLIAAAKRVCRELPDVKFVLVGDGQQRTLLEKEVRAAALEDHFLFLGYRKDIPELLSCCDVGVLASRAEGLPNAVLEYMAAGLPVIATRVGGIPEIIKDEVTGLLVPPEHSGALAAALLRVLQDTSFAERLGKAGREHVVAKFNFGALLQSLGDLYIQCPRESSISGHPSRVSLSDAK
jgi:L-malate glycosyltransferase